MYRCTTLALVLGRLLKLCSKEGLDNARYLRGGHFSEVHTSEIHTHKNNAIPVDTCESIAQDRQHWRRTLHRGQNHVEERLTRNTNTVTNIPRWDYTFIRKKNKYIVFTYIILEAAGRDQPLGRLVVGQCLTGHYKKVILIFNVHHGYIGFDLIF